MGDYRGEYSGEKQEQQPIAKLLASVEMTGLHGWWGGDGRLRTLSAGRP
jgi:hypothetical protein